VNIFLVLLISVFMAGYYMFFAPSARIPEQETEYAVSVADLRSIAECAIATHNAQIAGGRFEDICIEQNGIKSEFICMDSRNAVTACDAGGTKRPKYSFIITTTAPLHTSDYNEMMEILEQNFSTSGTLGIYQEGVVLAGGTTAKRRVPDAIQKSLNLEDGQLIYMTHYDSPDPGRVFAGATTDNITCPAGTTKTYRFGRWQCIGYNLKTSCGGDMVWNPTLMECVPDESRKPLCSGEQTAVIVDNVWECISPFAERTCPDSMIARLNYETLEWECVEDTNIVKPTSKCTTVSTRAIRGRGGATLRLATTSCTDCEKMVVDESTCEAVCVPDESKLAAPSCYPGNIKECTGPSRAFYFGFPNKSYITNVFGIAPSDVPFDTAHSQNRKFNCLDCGKGKIDLSKSISPYVAVCGD